MQFIKSRKQQFLYLGMILSIGLLFVPLEWRGFVLRAPGGVYGFEQHTLGPTNYDQLTMLLRCAAIPPLIWFVVSATAFTRICRNYGWKLSHYEGLTTRWRRSRTVLNRKT